MARDTHACAVTIVGGLAHLEVLRPSFLKVERDAAGVVTVTFPNGFMFRQRRPLLTRAETEALREAVHYVNLRSAMKG